METGVFYLDILTWPIFLCNILLRYSIMSSSISVHSSCSVVLFSSGPWSRHPRGAIDKLFPLRIPMAPKKKNCAVRRTDFSLDELPRDNQQPPPLVYSFRLDKLRRVQWHAEDFLCTAITPDSTLFFPPERLELTSPPLQLDDFY